MALVHQMPSNAAHFHQLDIFWIIQWTIQWIIHRIIQYWISMHKLCKKTGLWSAGYRWIALDTDNFEYNRYVTVPMKHFRLFW